MKFTPHKLYRNDRADGYGGVLIGIKSCILSELVENSPHLEVCTVLLYPSKSSTILLICVYRPPKHDVSYQSNLYSYIIAMTKNSQMLRSFVLVTLTCLI